MARKPKLKTAYGRHDDRYGFILAPLKHAPFMSPMPVAIFATREEAQTAATEHGYLIEWEV
jgi:hypothetical protein